MSIERWQPREDLSRQEQALMKRLDRVRKLLGFLRVHRRRLFDDAFQAELSTMYRDTGAGKDPVPPALMAMATFVQAYLAVSDAEMVELTVVDLRVQMVLDCLGADTAAFSQGALCDFRERLIRTDMDRRLLERTVELARETGGFDWRKLPRSLRVAVDSSPFDGAGRVEDTFNLLGHAARKLVQCVARWLRWRPTTVAEKAGTEVLLASSIKAALDVDWFDPAEKSRALQILLGQLTRLESWVERHVPASAQSLVAPHLATLRQIREQDIEDTAKGPRIRQGVAHDRRISIEDSEMRHGRKSTSYAFNGYKRHVATDLDAGLIVAVAVTPANLPEQTAMPVLQDDFDHQRIEVAELFIDRGYIASDFVEHVIANGGEVICRPWQFSNRGLFAKADFDINIRDRTITCPQGQTQHFTLGTTVSFDGATCRSCPARAKCTKAEDRGRQVRIAPDEALQQRLRHLVATPTGRDRLRERVPVEHRLAHIASRQGPRARYCGVRKNTFDLRRAAAVQNLEAAHRSSLEDARRQHRAAA
ncbi:MAG TPA: IS1182 family transposase [Polyangiales bacterium]|nr:IS1182 family transposase [Polyangiales bacterium]